MEGKDCLLHPWKRMKGILGKEASLWSSVRAGKYAPFKGRCDLQEQINLCQVAVERLTGGPRGSPLVH